MSFGRRGFLGRMLFAPVAAAGAVETGVSQVGIGTVEPSGQSNRRIPREVRDFSERLRGKAYEDQLFDIPENVESKKSWSAAFKMHVARQEYRQRQDLHRQIDDVLYGDTLDKMAALRKLAKRMGV